MDIKQLRLIRDFLGELTTEDVDRIIEKNGLTIDSRETDNALYDLYDLIDEMVIKEENTTG